MPYDFFLTNDSKSLQPKVAKNDYFTKHSNNNNMASAAISATAIMGERNFIEAEAAAGKKIFNGEKAIFYTKNGDNTLKIVPSDYAGVRAASKSKAKDAESLPDLRQHFCAGVIIACVTKDGKVVVGSREDTRGKDKTDPTAFKAQFPCGFIDVDAKTNFFTDISKSGQTALVAHFQNNALRELREEVINFRDDQISKVEYLGGIFDDKKWPSKTTGIKEIKNFKSFIVKVDVNMTFSEIMAEREQNPPIDAHEIRSLNAVALEEIVANKGKPITVSLEGKDREFVAEHPVTFNILQKHLELSAKKGNQPRDLASASLGSSSSSSSSVGVITQQPSVSPASSTVTAVKESRGCEPYIIS